jgi:hypothetical protein
MRVFLGLCALVGYLVLGFDADSAVLECTTDLDCEIKAPGTTEVA